MAGTLTISTLSDGTNSTSATNCIQGSAKAWATFNGTNATIRASYNVSSIVRNSTGNYTINFTNAMPDNNYSVSGAGSWVNAAPSTLVGVFNNGGILSTSCNVIFLTNGGDAPADVLYCYVQFHR